VHAEKSQLDQPGAGPIEPEKRATPAQHTPPATRAVDALIRAAAAGDQAAFDRIYGRWFDRIYAIAWVLTRDHAAAERMTEGLLLGALAVLPEDEDSEREH
jgi:hypothetical protein